MTQTQTIKTADWTTVSEASRILGVSPQRVAQMADDGNIDIIRPWPHVPVSVVSVEAWQNGWRPQRIQPFDAVRFVLNATGADSIVDVDEATLGAFIAAARPAWSPEDRVEWVQTARSRLWRTATRAD